jgi:hypothetical protein
MTVEQAKQVLKDNGYCVENLWSVWDVQSMYNCTDDEAQDVLSGALQNDATMEQIWFAIDYHAKEDLGLNKLEK